MAVPAITSGEDYLKQNPAWRRWVLHLGHLNPFEGRRSAWFHYSFSQLIFIKRFNNELPSEGAMRGFCFNNSCFFEFLFLQQSKLKTLDIIYQVSAVLQTYFVKIARLPLNQISSCYTAYEMFEPSNFSFAMFLFKNNRYLY